jgi:hypothetical protein
MPIRPYLDDVAAFEPEAVDAMSRALEETCKALHVNGHAHDRQVVAARIIDLARTGILDAKALSNGCWRKRKPWTRSNDGGWPALAYRPINKFEVHMNCRPHHREAD